MTFSLINNRPRFNQKADFSNMLFSGTDIDFFAEVDTRLYLLVEWKSLGTGLPMGQSLGFKRHTKDLGKVKPTFHVIAYHDTTPDEAIHGENSFVAQVMYRLPNMTRMEEYHYENEVPSLNQWLADFSYQWRVQKVLRSGPIPLWEGIPQIDLESWDRVSQPKGPSAFFDHIKPLVEAYEFK